MSSAHDQATARRKRSRRPVTESEGLSPQERALLSHLRAEPETVTLSGTLDWLWSIFPTASDRHRDERVRLRHSSSLAFNACEIQDVELDHEPERVTLTIASLGLCGSGTMLPHYLAEEADGDDDAASAHRGLLDIFHHRVYTHLFRGLTEIDLARIIRADGSDPWSRRILALFGSDETRDGDDNEPTIPPALALRLAPIFASGVRSPAMLAAALRIATEAKLGQAALRVEAFAGGWMSLDESQWTRLGEATAVLGETAIAGTEVFYPAGAANIIIGPLTGDYYETFTPGSASFARISKITRDFTPDPIHFDLVLEIEDYAHPPGILGQRRLGEDLWLAFHEHRGIKDRKSYSLEAARGSGERRGSHAA